MRAGATLIAKGGYHIARVYVTDRPEPIEEDFVAEIASTSRYVAIAHANRQVTLLTMVVSEAALQTAATIERIRAEIRSKRA